MGGRGASSGSTGTKTVSYEQLIKREQNTKYNLTFNKSVDISQKGYLPITKKYKDIDYSKINEAVVTINKGLYDRHTNLLKKQGYKILEQTKFSEKDPDYKQIKVYIRR